MTSGLQRAGTVTVLGTSRFCLAATLMLYQNPVLTHGCTERSRTASAVSSPPAGVLQGSQGLLTSRLRGRLSRHRSRSSPACPPRGCLPPAPRTPHQSQEHRLPDSPEGLWWGPCRALTGRSLPASVGHVPSTQPKPLADPDSPVSVPGKDPRF